MVATVIAHLVSLCRRPARGRPAKALTLVKAGAGRSADCHADNCFRESRMSVQQVDKSGWAVFFDNLTRTLVGKQAEIEVASLDIGDQIEAEWAPLIGITYDHKDDLIEVALEGIDHLITAPKEVRVDYDVGGLIAIEIVESDGTSQIVKLKDPLALPAPSDHSTAEPAS
jgi:hypothetical protein